MGLAGDPQILQAQVKHLLLNFSVTRVPITSASLDGAQIWQVGFRRQQFVCMCLNNVKLKDISAGPW